MSAGWKQDKRWSDRFIPEISAHLGELLICEPPAVEDMERNSDLMVLGMSSVRIGCRIRKHSYRAGYGDEFTIRASRPSGQKTELIKIVEGWGDYFFYGFSNEDETSLCQWFVGDLNVFRGWFTRSLARMDHGELPGTLKNNRDNSSSMRVFKIHEMPQRFVRSSGGLLVPEAA